VDDAPYGSAARLVAALRDAGLTYQAFGLTLDPPVTKGAVSAWTRQVAIPSAAYRRQIDDWSRGLVPQGGWAPTTRDVVEARALLARAARVREEVALVAAARTLERATRVRAEVKRVPKAGRQRWTRWQQQRLSLAP